jgi:uncharacterized protein YbaA (DUF1428 family)
MKGYVDLILSPVPKKNLAAYKRLANSFGKLALEHGALAYREFIGDDVRPKGVPPFDKLLKVNRNEVAIIVLTEFKSRKHRDSVGKTMFADPKWHKLMKKVSPLFDMKKMYFAGFETIVEPKP